MGHNRFSTKMPEEGRGRQAQTAESLLGATDSTSGGSQVTYSTDSLPASVDWTGHVTAVHDDESANCITDWAYVASDMAATSYSITGGQLYNLSPQQLIDCVDNISCRSGGRTE